MANSTDTTTSDDQILTEAAAYKRLYPAEYLERFVAEEVRPDGREKGQWRDVRINVGKSILQPGPGLSDANALRGCLNGQRIGLGQTR